MSAHKPLGGHTGTDPQGSAAAEDPSRPVIQTHDDVDRFIERARKVMRRPDTPPETRTRLDAALQRLRNVVREIDDLTGSVGW